MLRVMLAELNPIVGDLCFNISEHKKCIDIAKKAKIDLLVFPELSLTGYPIDDVIQYSWWLDRIPGAIRELCQYSDGVSLLIGAPLVVSKKENKTVGNSAIFISEKKVQSIYQKVLLPTYGIFDEKRHFVPGENKLVVSLKGMQVGVCICEDAWYVPSETNSFFKRNPLELLRASKIDLLINMSASPFDMEKINYRRQLFNSVSQYLNCPVAFCNQWGGQDHLVFDGSSFVICYQYKLYEQLPSFKQGKLVFDLYKNKLPLAVQSCSTNNKEDMERSTQQIHLIKQAICCGLKDYCRKLGFNKVLVALSGGVDSSVVACLAVETLGKENVLGVYLPSEFNPRSSYEDVIHLTKLLDISMLKLPISDVQYSLEQCLTPYLNKQTDKITFENLQARTRGIIMMSLANGKNALLLATSNKSEVAMGFSTLYGDSCGALSIIGDLYKTQVYALARIINQKTKRIPTSILTKAPSAELAWNQKDSDRLPSYLVLDPWLQKTIENKEHPLQGNNLMLGRFKKKELFNQLHRSEFKRRQLPFILKLSPQSFHVMDRRVPISSKFFS